MLKRENTGDLTTAEILKEFRDFLQEPYTRIRKEKTLPGARVIGYLIPGVPPELIHASGALPLALLGSSRQNGDVDVHLSKATCALVRSNLGLALSGELDFLDGVVLTHSCECVRDCSYIWYDIFPTDYFDVLNLPRKLYGGPAVKERFLNELSRFKASLEEFSGRVISGQDLERSIALHNENRRLLRRLYDIMRAHPALISSRSLFEAIKSSTMMPKEDHNRLLSQLVSKLEHSSKSAPDGRARLVIVGMEVEPLEVMDIVEEAGGCVVGDNMAIGTRLFAEDVPLDKEPIEAMMEQHIASPLFSSYVDSRVDRLQALLDLVRDNKADGVLFVIPFQCDSYVYDYPTLKDGLDKAGIPHTMIQTDLWTTSLQQLKTRVEAFMEIIRGI